MTTNTTTITIETPILEKLRKHIAEKTLETLEEDRTAVQTVKLDLLLKASKILKNIQLEQPTITYNPAPLYNPSLDPYSISSCNSLV